MRDLSELKLNEGGKPMARPAPSAEVIQAFQACYGLTLPNDYLTLLHHSNGGHPKLDSIKPIGGRPGATGWAVNRFYHLDHDRTSTGSLWRAMEIWRPILGDQALPIATDGGGNLFFIDLRTASAAVKVCVHDDDFTIVDLAPSFQAFIDGLSENPDMI
jgi:hypothetical protein